MLQQAANQTLRGNLVFAGHGQLHKDNSHSARHDLGGLMFEVVVGQTSQNRCLRSQVMPYSPAFGPDQAVAGRQLVTRCRVAPMAIGEQ